MKEICKDDCEDKTDVHMKTIDLVFSDETIEAEKRLVHSINEMDNGLMTLGINTYDLDNLAPTLLAVYDSQQEKYNKEDTFSLLSLVGMALLELGVIIECDETE